MNLLRQMADRLVGKMVPEVKASALWYWEYQCVSANCGGVTGLRKQQKRNCYDGSGFCYGWQDTGYCCR